MKIDFPEPLAIGDAWGFVADFLNQYGIDLSQHQSGGVAKKILSEPIPEGERNNTLASIGGSLRHRGANASIILSTLKAINHEQCRPPLPDKEVEAIAQSISRYEPKQKPDSRFSLGGNPESGNEFRLKSLAELQTEPDEDIPWLIDELLPLGGTSLDAAKPKVGKTTKDKNLARVVVTGGTFLDRKVHTTGKVLYYALEEKKSEFLGSFRRMGFQSDKLLVHFGMAPAEPLAALAADIEAHKPVLVVIDPLLRFIRVADLNDYAKVSLAMEPINELARHYNCHIMCAHHLGKSDREDGDDVLGSTALFASVDTLLVTKKDKDGTRKIKTIQRYGRDLPEMVLELDEETHVVRTTGTYAAVQHSKLRDQIIEVLTGELVDESTLREAVGGNQKDTAIALREMVDEGLVERTGKGKRGNPYLYTAIPQENEAVVENAPNEAANKISNDPIDEVLKEVFGEPKEAEPQQCYTCKGTVFRERPPEAGGGLVCNTCHPDPTSYAKA